MRTSGPPHLPWMTIASPFQPPVKKARLPLESIQNCSQCFSAGTYTLKVPPGRYRIELELHEGERLVRQPGETNVNSSDLDPRRDFEIAMQ